MLEQFMAGSGFTYHSSFLFTLYKPTAGVAAGMFYEKLHMVFSKTARLFLENTLRVNHFSNPAKF